MAVDTKKYGLPQTRSRKYLLAWKAGTYGGLDEATVAASWKKLVQSLETTLDHPVEAFLLPDSSDRIRRFRDVLRSPIAQRLAAEQLAGGVRETRLFTAPSVDRLAAEQWGGDLYTTNRNANTRYFLGFRNCIHMLPERDHTNKSVNDAAELGANMDINARPLTRWGPQAPPKLLSPYWMQDVCGFWSQHSLDHAEIKAIKNAEAGVDLLHHNALVDLSQNPHLCDTVNKPGITGCLTPGGQMYHFKRGREISGFEKLLLSGIPADQLLLGGESEVQLSDLAGNAMSLPVVSACILSAFCIAPHAAAAAAAATAAKDEAGESSAEEAEAAPPHPPSAAPEPAAAPSGAEHKRFSFGPFVGLAGRAQCCSVLCTCESSGDVSKHGILRCSCCQATLCGMCAAHVQLESHTMLPLHPEGGRFGADAAAGDGDGATPEEFEGSLRRAMPDALQLEEPLAGSGIGTGPSHRRVA